MEPKVSREAGWRETLEQVSLVDVGRQLKSTVIGAIAYIIWIGFWSGAAAGGSALGWGFHVPTIIWIALGVFVVVLSITSERSYHEWTIRFFFPRLRFVGWATVTTYITLIVEALRLTKALPGVSGVIAFGAIYLILIAPVSLLLGLLDLGYGRLMSKREADRQPQSISDAADRTYTR